MRRILSILLIIVGINSFGQKTDAYDVHFENCDLTAGQINNFNSNGTEFQIDYNATQWDTLKFDLVHHRGTAPLDRVTYIFTNKLNHSTINWPTIKPGDELSFFFKNKEQTLKRTFKINSTVSSTTKPYYLNLFFVYNKDTVKTDQYFFRTKLKFTDNTNFIRVQFDNPKELPKKLRIDFGKKIFIYEFDHPMVLRMYHGKIVLEYFDKRRLVKGDPFNKRIHVTDLDSRDGYGHAEMQ